MRFKNFFMKNILFVSLFTFLLLISQAGFSQDSRPTKPAPKTSYQPVENQKLIFETVENHDGTTEINMQEHFTVKNITKRDGSIASVEYQVEIFEEKKINGYLLK